MSGRDDFCEYVEERNQIVQIDVLFVEQFRIVMVHLVLNVCNECIAFFYRCGDLNTKILCFSLSQPNSQCTYFLDCSLNQCVFSFANRLGDFQSIFLLFVNNLLVVFISD